jgi:hypothetical protein
VENDHRELILSSLFRHPRSTSGFGFGSIGVSNICEHKTQHHDGGDIEDWNLRFHGLPGTRCGGLGLEDFDEFGA